MIVRTKRWLGASVLTAAVIAVSGCSSVVPESATPQSGTVRPLPTRVIERPRGILGRAVNSPGDDFALNNYVDSAGRMFLYTTNRNGREHIQAIPEYGMGSDDASTALTLRDMPLTLLQHRGTAAGASVARVFAISAASKQSIAATLGHPISIHGGSDLFQQSATGKTRALDEVNSAAWDAHPAVATSTYGSILVFASDRKSDKGFSAPYGNASHVKGTDTVHGNADLWVSFRLRGDTMWSSPVNIAELPNGTMVNTGLNEYSPFLYCVDDTPHLLFSSNRDGNYDIYDARIDIDWDQPTLRVRYVRPVSKVADTVNSRFTELFPFVPYPHGTTMERDLFFASDRFERERPDDARQAGFGGLDMYATKVWLPCGRDTVPTPVGSLTYEVVLLNRIRPNDSIPRPRIRLRVNSELPVDTSRSALRITIPSEALRGQQRVRIASAGWSDYRKAPCEGNQTTVTHYRDFTIRRSQRIDTTIIKEQTIIAPRPSVIKISRDDVARDTIPMNTTIRLASYGSRLKAIRTLDGCGAVVEYAVRRTYDSIVQNTKPVVVIRPTQRHDTTYTFDTLSHEGFGVPSRSILSMFGDLHVPVPQSDTVVRDTIYLLPHLEEPPPCVQHFDLTDTAKNVPYFQTGFWEVNTSDGLRQHLQRLTRGGDLYTTAAKSIELHRENTYWIQSEASLDRRKAEYKVKAKLVDRNIDSLCNSTLRILRSFWQFDSAKPESKVVISMLAYSDIREIRLGTFFSDSTVSYIASSYDTVSHGIRPPTVVEIRPGTSLVSKSNDTLSKLRAYYGYRTVWEQLRRDSLVAELEKRGLILVPDQCRIVAEYEAKKATARIILLAEGRFYDGDVIARERGYGKGRDNYRKYDWVRRVDVVVRRISMKDGVVTQQPCCR